MTQGGKPLNRNRLWLARKRMSLGQKQVAHLLGHRTRDQISRYERGLRTPTLRIAMELSIIYRTPLHLLFPDLYRQVQEELLQRIDGHFSLSEMYKEALSEQESPHQYCGYVELLQMPHLSQSDAAKIRDHITRLAKKLAYL